MFCTRCGQKLHEGERFCRACGQETAGFAPLAPVDPSAPPLTIPVGAPIDAQPPYAGFWLRFAAYSIDGVILGIPFGILVIILIFTLGGFGLLLRGNSFDPRAAAPFAAPVMLGLLFGALFFVGLQWLYFAGMESSARQGTLGKSAMSLRVTDLEGRRLSFGHATGRFFAKLVSGLIPLAIGYVMAGFTEKKQALHDMIAGTLVLRKL